jgi:hypothetical protein
MLVNDTRKDRISGMGQDALYSARGIVTGGLYSNKRLVGQACSEARS